MPRRPVPYSDAELAFIEARQAMRRSELHAAFVRAFSRDDVAVDHIKALCTRKGWTNRERWSPEDEAFLRDLYPNTPTGTLAKRFGRSVSATYRRAAVLGLAKSEAYLASPAACRLRRGEKVGAAHRFQSGHVPANKGLRRPGWAAGQMQSSQFKKGQRGWNWKPIGSERVIDGYRYTKVSDERCVPWLVNWKPTHILLWERLHGPVPEGMALKSLDGNRGNADPANWEAIPRGLLPRLSGKSGRDYDGAPAELKPTILAVAKLEHAAATRRKAVA